MTSYHDDECDEGYEDCWGYNDFDSDDYDDYSDNFYNCVTIRDNRVISFIRNIVLPLKRKIIHNIRFALSKHYRDHYDDLPF